jgi:CubicO group peptidase (beta-lactamase class C family)
MPASIALPEAEGYSTPKLEMVRAFLEDLDTSAAIVILRGRVLFQYGNVERVSYVASVRKSVLAMLFGEHVARGEIHETATLSELGVDDVGGLLAEEKQATLGDLMTARSGVYHPAANPGDDLKDAPARGSKRPGTWFLYNNWDFKRTDQQKARNDGVSIHPAYHMYLSTRDMARLGYLMLRGGSWSGRELVPSSWVAELTTPTSHVEDVHGYEAWGFAYGKLWWL